jgi:hypothetical protein
MFDVCAVPISGDCENYITPAKLARLVKRNQARIARLAREKAEAEAKAVERMDGVILDLSAHTVANNGSDYVGGILLTDGTIHLFDRDDFEHSEYASTIGVSVQCGMDSGDDGWGFYFYGDSNKFSGYKMPDEYHETLEMVVRQLLNQPANEPVKGS